MAGWMILLQAAQQQHGIGDQDVITVLDLGRAADEDQPHQQAGGRQHGLRHDGGSKHAHKDAAPALELKACPAECAPMPSGHWAGATT